MQALSAGTNSEEPLVNDVKSGTMEDLCAGISLRPAVIKAGLFGQGHVDSVSSAIYVH